MFDKRKGLHIIYRHISTERKLGTFEAEIEVFSKIVVMLHWGRLG